MMIVKLFQSYFILNSKERDFFSDANLYKWALAVIINES